MGIILAGKNPGLSGIFTEAAACTFKGNRRGIYLPAGSYRVWAGFLPENLFSGRNSFLEFLEAAACCNLPGLSGFDFHRPRAVTRAVPPGTLKGLQIQFCRNLSVCAVLRFLGLHFSGFSG